jgi:hypothetical protein
MKMMTREEIRMELGWTENMIHSLLQNPDSNNARRNKQTGGYTCGLYRRASPGRRSIDGGPGRQKAMG